MTSIQPNPVISTRYAEALGDQDPIEALRKGAQAREEACARSLREAALEAPGGRQVVDQEVIAHLADGEVIIGSRLRFAAAMDRAPLTSWDEKLFAERLGVERARTKDLLASFADVRAANIELLERLDETAFDRVAIHAERGPESVRTMVAMYAGHDVIHERQIERVLESSAPRRAKRRRARRPKRNGRGRSKRSPTRPRRRARPRRRPRASSRLRRRRTRRARANLLRSQCESGRLETGRSRARSPSCLPASAADTPRSRNSAPTSPAPAARRARPSGACARAP